METKEATLAGLYQLRAGMSFITKKLSTMKEIREGYDNLKKSEERDIKDLRAKRARISEEFEENNKRIKKHRENVRYETDYAEDCKGDIVTYMFRNIALTIVFVLIVGVVGLFGVGTAITFGAPIEVPFFKSFFDFFKDTSFLSVVGGVAGTVVSIIGGVRYIIWMADDMYPDVTSARHRRYKSLNSVLESRNEVARLKRRQEELKALTPADDAEAVIHRAYDERKKQYKQRYDAPFLEARIAAEATLMALDNTAIIDSSDWESTDLLIYYLQTRRADNIKDALACLDRQKQTSAIVNAVKQAHQDISAKMDASTRSLSSTISTSMQNLSSEIRAGIGSVVSSVKKLDSRISDVSARIDESNSRLSSLCTGQALQSAMIEKMSSNSSYLADSVDSLRSSINSGVRTYSYT
ncbi:MAG: hypothetical protein J6L90_04570 [Clostridia bacterium]|nr:hypothetical protein [Clostridia bacterium]